MIGIMSDSHDNLDAIRKAVCFFSNLNCELVIHAGDFVAPFAASEMGRLACADSLFLGNRDMSSERNAGYLKGEQNVSEN